VRDRITLIYKIKVQDVPRAIFDLEPYSKAKARLVRPERGERASAVFIQMRGDIRAAPESERRKKRCVAFALRNPHAMHAWFWPINSRSGGERKNNLHCCENTV
jgi:hypothetical protein